MNKDLIEQVLSVLNDLGVSDERIGPALADHFLTKCLDLFPNNITIVKCKP